MNKLTSAISMACAFAMCACAVDSSSEGGSEGPSDAEIPVATAPTAAPSSTGQLMAEISEQKVSGKLENEADSVTFESVAAGGDVYEVTLHVHGMTLDATFSLADKAASLDGFTSESGADTQLLENDRQALKAFYSAIQSKAGKDAPKSLDMLVRAAGIWSETGDSVPLSRRVMGDQDRGWTLLCDRLGTYVDGTHDDWSHGDWSATSSYHVFIGDYGPSTYYWHSDVGWTTQAYDHAAWPYEYGNCYGRCGSDCGGGHVYSQDCLNHDGCVRNGHSMASFWCDDEFASTTDDFSFAPNCY
jgi:hypothetical protein